MLYAVDISDSDRYVAALRDHLQELYPLRLLANSSYGNNLAHIYFKDFNYFVEYTPLLVAYFVLFLYLYFSVRKSQASWLTLLNVIIVYRRKVTAMCWHLLTALKIPLFSKDYLKKYLILFFCQSS